MLQSSKDSINQFLQSKSTRNNFSHYIKYTSASNIKERYFDKSILNKNNKIISPKINLPNGDRLKTSINENHINNYLKNIRHINQINSSGKIINKSSDNFPRIILTKRGFKQLTGKTMDLEHENRINNNYLVVKTEKKGEIRRAKSGYIETQLNEEQNSGRYNYRRRSYIQESSSLPSFRLNNYSGINENYNKGSSNSSKKTIYEKNEYATNINRDYRRNNNNTVNLRLNNTTNRTRRIINYKNYVNVNISNDRRNTLENDSKTSHYSLNNIYEQKNQNRKNHNFVSITNRKIEKEEIRQEYKRANSIITDINDYNLNPSSSNKISNISTKYIVNTKKRSNTETDIVKLNNNTVHHIVYKSKDMKTEKPKQKIVTVNIINKNENKENANINKNQNYKKITKISKIQEKNNEENDKDKSKINNEKNSEKINKISSLKNSGLNLAKEELKENKQNKNEIISDIKNKINDNQLNSKQIKDDTNNLVNENKEKEPKNNLKKLNKNKNNQISLKEKIDALINSKLNEKKENISINKVDIKEPKLIKKKKSKKFNKNNEKEKDNKTQNKNILEICKSSEIIFNETKKEENVVAQNNTTSSNIIIIINNSKKKKITNIIKSPKKIEENNKNNDANKNSNMNIKDNNQTNKTIDTIIEVNVKKKKINKKIIKNDKKIERKHVRIENNINDANKIDNNIKIYLKKIFLNLFQGFSN